MHNQQLKEIEGNLQEAINIIGDAAGAKPLGFRAPAFSIPRNRLEIYDLLSKYFEYDSSYILLESDCTNKNFFDSAPFNLKNISEFPIIPKTYFNKINIKSGGTFFRLFPSKIISSVMKKNAALGFTPLIYLHPYDYLYDLEFKVEYRNFLGAGLIDGTKRYLRQSQWLQLNNKSTLNKLIKLSNDFDHIGPMKLALKNV